MMSRTEYGVKGRRNICRILKAAKAIIVSEPLRAKVDYLRFVPFVESSWLPVSQFADWALLGPSVIFKVASHQVLRGRAGATIINSRLWFLAPIQGEFQQIRDLHVRFGIFTSSEEINKAMKKWTSGGKTTANEKTKSYLYWHNLHSILFFLTKNGTNSTWPSTEIRIGLFNFLVVRRLHMASYWSKSKS